MADFMFQNMAYRATVYRTGRFTKDSKDSEVLHFAIENNSVTSELEFR